MKFSLALFTILPVVSKHFVNSQNAPYWAVNVYTDSRVYLERLLYGQDLGLSGLVCSHVMLRLQSYSRLRSGAGNTGKPLRRYFSN